MDFTYKGTTAASYGIIVNSMNWFIKPQRSADTVRIQGKDGATVIDDSYEPFVIPAKITLTALTNIDAITAWLTGNGVLSFSGDAGKYRNVYILEAVQFVPSGSVWEANIDFYCADVYRYVTSEATVTKSSFPASYTNAGTVASKPLLKVTGTGTVVFVVNGVSMTYVFDTAFVYIDCDSKDAFWSSVTLKNSSLTLATGTNGERLFPYLSVGSNSITVTSGTITEIVITPRTRYL